MRPLLTFELCGMAIASQPVCALETLRLERAPEALGRGRLDVGGGVGLRHRVAEDHVAVEVVARGHAGPFVADERGEAARGAAVVVGLGGVLDLAPRTAAGLAAAGAVRAAERIAGGMLAAVDVAVHEHVAELGKSPDHATHERVMARERGVLADLGLAEQVAVVGDDREVERAAQLDRRRARPSAP